MLKIAIEVYEDKEADEILTENALLELFKSFFPNAEQIILNIEEVEGIEEM